MGEEQTYLLKEFDKINGEIAKLLEEIRSREKYSLTIIAAVSAWMYTTAFSAKTETILSKEQVLALIRALSWVPLMTTLLYAISVILLYKNIKWFAAYLERIENLFLKNYVDKDGVLMGWEKYFAKEHKKIYFVMWTWTFWMVQILMSILIISKSYNFNT